MNHTSFVDFSLFNVIFVTLCYFQTNNIHNILFLQYLHNFPFLKRHFYDLGRIQVKTYFFYWQILRIYFWSYKINVNFRGSLSFFIVFFIFFTISSLLILVSFVHTNFSNGSWSWELVKRNNFYKRIDAFHFNGFSTVCNRWFC